MKINPVNIVDEAYEMVPGMWVKICKSEKCNLTGLIATSPGALALVSHPCGEHQIFTVASSVLPKSVHIAEAISPERWLRFDAYDEPVIIESYRVSIVRWAILEPMKANGKFDMKQGCDPFFAHCIHLKDIYGLDNLDTSDMTDFTKMFFECRQLRSIAGVGTWDVSNADKMNQMFCGCRKLEDCTPLAGWDVSNVRNMYKMFGNCKSLEDLSALANWNTGNVYDTQNMFASCRVKNLTGLDNWDMSSVQHILSMFINCTKLEDISAISRWNVENAYCFASMFSGCHRLTSKAMSAIGGWKITRKATQHKSNILRSFIADTASVPKGTASQDFNDMTKVLSNDWAYDDMIEFFDKDELTFRDASFYIPLASNNFGCRAKDLKLLLEAYEAGVPIEDILA